MSCFCNSKVNPGATWKLERSSCPMCVFTLGSEMAAEPEAQTRLFPSLTNTNHASASLHTCMCSIGSLQTATHDGFQTYVQGWSVLNLSTPLRPSSPVNTHEYFLFLPFKAGQGHCQVDNQLMAILTFCSC